MNFLPSALRPHGRDQLHDLEKDGISGPYSPSPPGPPLLAHRTTVLEPAAMEQLDTFRHMVGIHTTKGFIPQLHGETSHNTLHFDGRAAPNVGIYNRVCHRESQAKRGYKFATLFINGCLGLQIIVAAALTAMGAANSSHVGITAFGAINTVIAGILTYLKGSGLPNRIRYYENEWKRVREYIEQRERDFSRQDCRLDVNEIVSTIEVMYEQVKADIRSNTPDNYISVTDTRARATASTAINPHMSVGGGRNKLEELELKYGHKVTDFLESLAHKEEERLKRIEGDIDTSKAKALPALQKGRSAVQGGRAQWEKELEDARDWERDMEEKGARTAQRELEDAKSGLLSRGLSFAKELEQTKADVLKRSDAVARDLDDVKTSAIQQGREYGQDVHAKTARYAETGRDLESEAEHTRLAAQRAEESIQQAGDILQRAGDSVSRVARAVDDEIQPHRRD